MDYFIRQKLNQRFTEKLGYILYILIVTLLPAGCAKIIHKPIASGTGNDKGDGLRYYHSSPYLLAYSNGKGGIVTQILYIADPYKKMMATPKSTMAKLKTELAFNDGVFTSSKDEMNSVAVPEAIVKAIETAAPALLAAMNAPSINEMEVPAPYLYKIIVNENKVSFVGGQGDTPIHVNLLKQNDTKKQ